MAHVKGPWAYDGATNHVVSTTDFEPHWDPDEPADAKRVICTYGAMGGDDNRADLALIVASPELLSMVDRMAERLEAAGIAPEVAADARALAGRARDPRAMRLHGGDRDGR